MAAISRAANCSFWIGHWKMAGKSKLFQRSGAGPAASLLANQEGFEMTLAPDVEPIKIGVLMDIITRRAGEPSETMKDLLDPFRFIFDSAVETGRLDRPIEIVYRQCQGLPRGSTKAVIDTFEELVDAGCVLICGPNISENTSAVREEIERRFRVPAITMAGSDKWLGEWTFNLCNGSMSDEPAFIAALCRRNGHKTIGVLVERSTIGFEYLAFFRKFAAIEGLDIVCEAIVAQNEMDGGAAAARLKASGCDAVVHWGFGLGVYGFNDALARLGRNPPRYSGTAWECAYANEEIKALYMGFVGLDQYDEENPVAQAFLDRFEAAYGRRPEYYMPLVAHDIAQCVVEAVSNATPLSPRGVKEALERVKMLPAASGSKGTRISFGQWTRRGWMGASYLTAREFTGEGFKTVLRGRYEA
jgi:branched-chain amino acid transport system substrate-binding protein